MTVPPSHHERYDDAPHSGESLKFHVGDKTFELKGRDIVLIILLGFFIFSTAWLVHYTLEKWGTPFNIKSVFDAHHAAMTNQHTDYVNGVRELTYVMAVCLNKERHRECEDLRIDMPDSLYQRIKR